MRISFLGGGTDFPDSIHKWGGLVVGTTINKYCYITARRLPSFFEYKTRLSYSKIETVESNLEIEHNAIRHTINRCGCKTMPLEITHMADLPSYSGTGSSSSFVVGLANALLALNHEKLAPYDLYHLACSIEQQSMGEAVGCQDQAWAAFGGLNAIEWVDGRMSVQRIILPEEALCGFKDTLMLFFTKISRRSSDIAKSYVPTLSDKETEHYELLKLARRAIEYIQRRHFDVLGTLMDESWMIKKSFSNKVSNLEIDNLYCQAIANGANGGKITGAGGGGCMLLSVPRNKHDNVKAALEDLNAVEIPFRFEPNGSTIIHDDGVQ